MNNIIFWGSSEFSVYCLEELKNSGYLPILIITTPDKPTGRGLKLTANPVKIWAEKNKINCLTPTKLDLEFVSELQTFSDSLFLIASYGKIVPKNILELPKYGTLNIHPSLLPKYRGPSPLQEQILNDEKEIGISIMLIDEQVDHGPIIAQEKIEIPNWPIDFINFEKITAGAGVKIFIKILDPWLKKEIKPLEQNHPEATFTKKIKKIDGLIDIKNGNPYQNWLKILAYADWPKVFFFVVRGDKKNRVIIKEAEYKDNNLIIKKVLPEGKKEMSYGDFLRGLN